MIINKSLECPICRNNDFICIFNKDMQSFDSFHVFKAIRISFCIKCGFIINSAIPTFDALERYYSIESLYSSNTSVGTGGYNPEDFVRYSQRLEVLEPHIRANSKICDVGCAKGGFLTYLKSRGYNNIFGIEIDPELTRIANESGANVSLGSAQNLPNEKYDCLIYSHIFEHLYDFDPVLESAFNSLSDNGIVFIEVPNAQCYQEASPFDFYWFCSTKEHLSHFSSHYLALLMESNGFETLKATQCLVSYNNPDYKYPALMMIFKKKGYKKIKINFDSMLKLKIESYIQTEMRRIEEHINIVNNYVSCQTPIYCWGIGAEFFTISSFTKLNECNILNLVDQNTSKQQLTFNRMPIVSPDIFSSNDKNADILIFSVFNGKKMKDNLKNNNWHGNVYLL